jgi:hypothetical protein
MESLDIQGFTYEERQGLLERLTAAFARCGAWVVDRKTLSATNMELRVEVQLLAVLDLYADVMAAGVELPRAGHVALTELCTRRKHQPLAAELGQVVRLRFEISFLDDVTLHSLLTGAGAA